MSKMYCMVGTDANIEIDGFPFFAEEITSSEPYNRRDFKRVKIKGGTEFCTPGDYIPREYSFKTSVEIPPERPDVHDEIFINIMNHPAEVISPEMGRKFTAQVTIKKTHNGATPSMLDLEITIKEIPERASKIPNDTVEKLATEVLKTQEQANEEAKNRKQ